MAFQLPHISSFGTRPMGARPERPPAAHPAADIFLTTLGHVATHGHAPGHLFQAEVEIKGRGAGFLMLPLRLDFFLYPARGPFAGPISIWVFGHVLGSHVLGS